MTNWVKTVAATAMCIGSLCTAQAQTEVVTPYEWYPAKFNPDVLNFCKTGYVPVFITSLKQGKQGQMHYEFSTLETRHKGTLNPNQFTQEQMAYGLMVAAHKNKKLPAALCAKPHEDDGVLLYTYPKPYAWKQAKKGSNAPCGRDGKFNLLEVSALTKNANGTIGYQVSGIGNQMQGTLNPQKPKKTEVRLLDVLVANAGKPIPEEGICVAAKEGDPLFDIGD